MMANVRASAAMMTFCGSPALPTRSAKDLTSGLCCAATTAAWNITRRRARRQSGIARLPRRVPLPRATWVNPVSAAASSPVMAPISGISAIRFAPAPFLFRSCVNVRRPIVRRPLQLLGNPRPTVAVQAQPVLIADRGEKHHVTRRLMQPGPVLPGMEPAP